MVKLKAVQDAVMCIEDGMTLMVGGFLGVGSPETLISAIIERGCKDLTLICNDTGFPDKGVGRLVCAGLVKRVYTSHIGTNPESGTRMNDGRMEVILTPQGTLAEQVRAAGAGLGGVITPTGLGTVVEEGKQIIEIEGKRFLVERPLKADVALIMAEWVDEKGNCIYDKAARNFDPLMAMAADHVIVEAHDIVGLGDLDPNAVHTPHIFINVIVKEAQ